MKRSELQKCCLCGKGVMHSRQLMFSRVTVERLFVDLDAIRRLDGLENVFGGGNTGAALAAVMGTDEDIATRVNTKTLFACDECGSMRPVAVLELNEIEPKKV